MSEFFRNHLEPCMRNQASWLAHLPIEQHWVADAFVEETTRMHYYVVPLWWIPERSMFLMSVKCE